MKKFKRFLGVLAFCCITGMPIIAYCVSEESAIKNPTLKYLLIAISILFIAFILFLAYKLDNTTSSAPVKKYKTNTKEKKKNEQVIDKPEELSEEVEKTDDDDYVDYTLDINKYYDVIPEIEPNYDDKSSVPETPDTFIKELKNVMDTNFSDKPETEELNIDDNSEFSENEDVSIDNESEKVQEYSDEQLVAETPKFEIPEESNYTFSSAEVYTNKENDSSFSSNDDSSKKDDNFSFSSAETKEDKNEEKIIDSSEQSFLQQFEASMANVEKKREESAKEREVELKDSIVDESKAEKAKKTTVKKKSTATKTTAKKSTTKTSKKTTTKKTKKDKVTKEK